MTLPGHKTKIVCTIGPASAAQEVMVRMSPPGDECGSPCRGYGTMSD